MIDQTKYFTYEESSSRPGKYVIKPDCDAFHLLPVKGSANVICARVMGLTYAQYLRFCRDICRAEIIGKGNTYPVAYFTKNEMLVALVRSLNLRARAIIWEREHPHGVDHIEDPTPEMKQMWHKEDDIDENNA